MPISICFGGCRAGVSHWGVDCLSSRLQPVLMVDGRIKPLIFAAATRLSGHLECQLDVALLIYCRSISNRFVADSCQAFDTILWLHIGVYQVSRVISDAHTGLKRESALCCEGTSWYCSAAVTVSPTGWTMCPRASRTGTIHRCASWRCLMTRFDSGHGLWEYHHSKGRHPTSCPVLGGMNRILA